MRIRVDFHDVGSFQIYLIFKIHKVKIYNPMSIILINTELERSKFIEQSNILIAKLVTMV